MTTKSVSSRSSELQARMRNSSIMRNLLNLTLLLSIFSAARASDQWSFSAARKFFQSERITNVVVVVSPRTGSNEFPMESFFRSSDTNYGWSITVISNITSAVNVRVDGIVKNMVLFVSSSGDIDPSNKWAQLENTRFFIFHSNSSIDLVQPIFARFDSKMQSQVVVFQRTDNNFWKFFKFVGDRCSLNAIKSLVVVAECSDTEKSGATANCRHLSKGLERREKSCPLIVTTKQFEPFTYYDDVKGFYNGIDYSIVKTISERLRLQVKFVRAGNGSTIDPKTIE